MKVNRFQADILEGMACQGGCICGPATIENMPKAKARMTKENLAIKDKTIASTLRNMISRILITQIKNDEVGIGTFVTRFLPFNVEGFSCCIPVFRCV